MSDDNKTGALPSSVISPAQVAHLEAELSKLNEIITQFEIKSDRPDVKLNDITPELHEYLKLNNLDILNPDQRSTALNHLKLVSANAPVLHFSFAVDPSPDFTAKLVTWLRSNIHPLCLMVIGLAPDIGAGCYVRTTNKSFDLTLKTRLDVNRQNLINSIKDLNKISLKPSE